METIVVFDNLVQPHQNDIVGLTQNIKTIGQLDPAVTLRVEQSSEEFKGMFQQ